MLRPIALLSVLASLVLIGCGGGSDGAGASSGGGDDDQAPQPTAAAGPSSEELRADLRAATEASAADFPAPKGRTLQELADAEAKFTGPQLGLATSVFAVGDNRLAFGIIDRDTGFVYGKTAVYVASGPNGKAQGPFPAPADLLVTDTKYRSKTAASEDDPFAAIYSAQVPFGRPGDMSILVLSRYKRKFIGIATAVKVLASEEVPVPAVGEPAPQAETDTVVEAGGDIASIDTRVPPDDMHDVGYHEVLGKRPVALLFATPQLCESRVCGPVVDIALQMKARYGERMTFIHQEVYVDNDPNKGLREPLKRFGLPTEPWLFVVDADGRVAARLEGSFGLTAFEKAVRAGLR